MTYAQLSLRRLSCALEYFEQAVQLSQPLFDFRGIVSHAIATVKAGCEDRFGLLKYALSGIRSYREAITNKAIPDKAITKERIGAVHKWVGAFLE